MIELVERLKFVAIVLMMLYIHPHILMCAQRGDDGLPPFTKVWTDSEKMQFKECVSHLSDPGRESTLQLSADSYACLILEEEQHWMNFHPQARGKKENLAKKRKCFDKHPLQVKGTPEEFHSSFDLCMCAAYGLPKPKL